MTTPTPPLSALPGAEPVAWQWRYGDAEWHIVSDRKAWFEDETRNPRFQVRPLYTTPQPARAAVGLDRDGLIELLSDWFENRVYGFFDTGEETIRAIGDFGQEFSHSALADAILALSPPAVPGGWVMVPVEPDARLMSVVSSIVRRTAVPVSVDPDEVYFDNGHARKVYAAITDAMLSTAPTAPTEGDVEAALRDARDFIAPYSDMRDGDYGGQEPNEAMQIVHAIDQVLPAAPTGEAGA